MNLFSDSSCNKKQFVFVEDDIAHISEPNPPSTTNYTTEWAFTNYEEWRNAFNHNIHVPGSLVPLNVLENANIESREKWPSSYFVETRKFRGEKRLPKTIYQLLWEILYYARNKTSVFIIFGRKKEILISKL